MAWPIAEVVFGGLKALISPVSEYLQRGQELKAKLQDSKLRVIEAKTLGMEQRLTTGQAADIAWENTSIENAGWKDEWWTLVLSIPAIVCFGGTAAADWVTQGFAALATCPIWYQTAVGIAIASAFGYKKFADIMALKKGE